MADLMALKSICDLKYRKEFNRNSLKIYFSKDDFIEFTQNHLEPHLNSDNEINWEMVFRLKLINIEIL